MRIAVTGCNGGVGRRVVLKALKEGHTIVGIDTAAPPEGAEYSGDPRFKFLQVDLQNYEETFKALQDCEGVIALAALRNPGDYVALTHNTNVVISWNVLRAAAEHGITRIAQASSVNVIPLVWSLGPKLRYLPLDEEHPCQPDEPYGLSKLIMETQADAIVRRYPFMRIASFRLSWSVPTRSDAVRLDAVRRKNDLWGYVQEDSGAEAFLLALTSENGTWSGHEAFFITAADTSHEEESMTLKEEWWKDVPIKEGKDLSGRKGFFDCSKAERLLGWTHKNTAE